ncbi:MAG TPA: lamin tail domain-containing protein, partial [Thermoguttaceae bacterium]|nr:lamin tail domain-containing protein [Thermoguttaceae bacterium]
MEPRLVLNAGPLMITEFVAVNDSGLRDSFLEQSDWIEIHNPTDATIDLEGWSLSDDPDDLTQWQFPEATLDAGDYLVVFASGRGVTTAGGEMHTNFKLGGSGEYLALVQPDGFTIAHEYAPEFPEQYGDYSYGVKQEFIPLIDAEADLLYHVPTAADAGADWTATDFDDSAWQAKGSQS